MTYELSPTFGVVPSTIYVWLDYGIHVIHATVTDASNNAFEIRWPSHSEMAESANLLTKNRRNGPALKGVFGVLDGVRMPCSVYIDEDIQKAFFEGYTQSVEVTNPFVWDFKGQIIHAGINFLGSSHDSRVPMESGLYSPPVPLHTDRFCSARR